MHKTWGCRHSDPCALLVTILFYPFASIWNLYGKQNWFKNLWIFFGNFTNVEMLLKLQVNVVGEQQCQVNNHFSRSNVCDMRVVVIISIEESLYRLFRHITVVFSLIHWGQLLLLLLIPFYTVMVSLCLRNSSFSKLFWCSIVTPKFHGKLSKRRLDRP